VDQVLAVADELAAGTIDTVLATWNWAWRRCSVAAHLGRRASGAGRFLKPPRPGGSRPRAHTTVT